MGPCLAFPILCPWLCSCQTYFRGFWHFQNDFLYALGFLNVIFLLFDFWYSQFLYGFSNNVHNCSGLFFTSFFLFQALLPEGLINGNLGFTQVDSSIPAVHGMCFELIFTFVLLFVIHGVCDGRRNDVKGSAALAIGLAVAAVHLSGVGLHL